MGVIVVAIFLGMVYGAITANLWKSRLTENEFLMGLKMIDTTMIALPFTRLNHE